MFTIGELAEATGVSRSAIRFYERQGLLAEPLRSQAGCRAYTEEDLACLKVVACTKALGFSIPEIRELLDLKQRRPVDLGAVRRYLTVRLARFAASVDQASRAYADLLRLLDLPPETSVPVAFGGEFRPGARPVDGLSFTRELFVPAQEGAPSVQVSTVWTIERNAPARVLARLQGEWLTELGVPASAAPACMLAAIQGLRRWAQWVEAGRDAGRRPTNPPNLLATLQFDDQGNSILRIDGEEIHARFSFDRRDGAVLCQGLDAPVPWSAFVIALDLALRFLEPLAMAA